RAPSHGRPLHRRPLLGSRPVPRRHDGGTRAVPAHRAGVRPRTDERLSAAVDLHRGAGVRPVADKDLPIRATSDSRLGGRPAQPLYHRPAVGDPDTEGKRMAKRYDLVIVGGGAAALSAAIRADRNGVRALMIDGGSIAATVWMIASSRASGCWPLRDRSSSVQNRP